MEKIKTAILLTLLVSLGLLTVLISPLYTLLAFVSILSFLAIARQIDFQKLLLMLKNFAKNVSKMRFEIRAKLHTGFREYSDSVENEETSNRKYGFVR